LYSLQELHRPSTAIEEILQQALNQYSFSNDKKGKPDQND
jgi:hypothetical protein